LKTVEVRKPRYSVRIGPGVLAQAASFCDQYPTCFVLSDTNVGPLHADKLTGLKRTSRFDVPAGEGSKSLTTLENVLDRMVAAGCDRASGLLALGGGVVGDLGGLAAAMYMRGIGLVQLPTSLLAMVDSSVGGKTAVNLAGGKNLAGVFHAPREVYADTTTLATLPDVEYRSGLGEVVKTALLQGPLLERLEKSADAILRRDPDVVAGVVHDCVQHKARIVERDPFEANVRKTLNLGHTFAHAIEHRAGFGAVPHGVAVGVGLGMSLEISRALGLLEDEALPDRVAGLLRAFGLPRTIAELEGVKLDAAGLMSAMKRDKKSLGGSYRFVILLGGGMAIHDVKADEDVVREVLEASLAG
jgi:3-dehydroquinate synthase